MSMKVCQDCGTELSSKAKICPKCGRDQRSFYNKHKVLMIIFAIICLGAIGAALGGGDTNNTIPTSTQIEQKEKFTLVSHKKTTDSLGTTWIEGEIKNNTDKSYSYVQVTFNLYDKDGNQLGTAMTNINNLEPNATWKYKAIGLVTEKVESYKLVEITGW